MKVQSIQVIILCRYDRGWRQVEEYEINKEVYFVAEPGTEYRILVRNHAEQRKAIGCWVDGLKALTECMWVDPGKSVLIKGFPITADFKRSFTDVEPFTVAPLSHSEGGDLQTVDGRKPAFGTIKVAAYEVVKSEPYEATYEVTSVTGTPAGDVIATQLSSKTDIAVGVGTKLPTAEKVTSAAVKATLSWKLDTSRYVLLQMRYTDRKGMRLMQPLPQSNPIDLTDTQSSVLSVSSSPLSGHKRRREGPQMLEMLDLAADATDSSPARVIRHVGLQVAVNGDGFIMKSVTTPIEVHPDEAPRHSTYEARMAEFIKRARDALKLSDALDCPVWDTEGRLLTAFEEVLDAQAVVIGRESGDAYVPLSELSTSD